MSKALDEIYTYKRTILADLLHKCTEEQQERFSRMYPETDVKSFPEENLNWAIQQCERTVAKNEG